MLTRLALPARASFSAARASFSTKPGRSWTVYLSGEIHSDWRDVIKRDCAHLPIAFTMPNPSHEDSDDAAAIILGMEEERRNWDGIGARMNLIRTRTYIEEADVVVVRFGEKYRQWNAAFEAGYAVARNIPLITLHPPAISHMLKEVNAGALAVCEEPEQVQHISLIGAVILA
jgi:YtoQ family protein